MNGGAVAIAVIMTLGLLAMIAVRGLSHFWPADVVEAEYTIPGQPAITLIGEVTTREQVPTERLHSACLLYTSPSPRDAHESRMPSSA